MFQGSAIVAAGVILNFQAIQTYVIDAFTLHAASALAATAFLRSLCGFGFPLFAPDMFNKLGYGVGCSILGAAAIGFGVPSYVAIISVVIASSTHYFFKTLYILDVRRATTHAQSAFSDLISYRCEPLSIH